LKLLAIDTATEACSAALYLDGEIIEKYELAPRKHAELILPMVDSLLSDAEIKLTTLDALAFGRGPGAFTGVRIASGVIQGLAFASNLPTIAISTLAAMAQSAVSESKTIISAIDARMDEIYLGVFSVGDNDIVAPLSDEEVIAAQNVSFDLPTDCFGVGSGWDSYAQVLSEKTGNKLKGYDARRFPRASTILKLAAIEFTAGNVQEAADALPVYLRNKVTR
jgi:tRNA threonylcarbamoyladenosine biosynthesis protein TsaB